MQCFSFVSHLHHVNLITVHEGMVPEGTVPEGTVPEGTVPEGTVPEGTVPEGTVHEGTVHEGTVHEGTVHEGTVHEVGPMIFRDRGKRTEFAEFAPRTGKRDLNLIEKKNIIFFNLLVQNELLMINSTRFNR